MAAKFQTPTSVDELTNEGAIFNVSVSDYQADNANEEDQEYQQALRNFTNWECLGEDYSEGQPFELIAAKMFNLTPDGGIKKRILHEGYGNKPAHLNVVRVHYNAYIEFEAEPFDSTYARKKPHQFVLNNGEVIIGLNKAVESMKLTEKAEFLIEPELAYGKLGCLGRVPANSRILFVVELLETVDSGAAVSFETLPEEKQKDFEEVYKYCLALCARGKDLFGKNINNAIKEYNTAAHKLETVQLNDYSEQEKQQELLMRLYTNLLVCYTRVENPKKGCINFNKIAEMTKGTSTKIPAKVYFNNSKCLRMLGEYDLAMKRLKMALRVEPRNVEIANEILKLQEEHKEYLRKEAKMGKDMLGGIN